MKSPFCITFAGPVGSSKTPIAYYLSCNLNLPILNNDAMRVETQEDNGELNMDVYISKRDQRIKQMLEQKIDFIYDASVDREWPNKADWLKKYKYQTFIISLDFSLEKLLQLFEYKKYDQIQHLKNTYKNHINFVKNFNNVINLHLTDQEFNMRLEKSLKAVENWLEK